LKKFATKIMKVFAFCDKVKNKKTAIGGFEYLRKV